MVLPKIIDCRPAAIAKEIAPADPKFALIFFNMDSNSDPDSSMLLSAIDRLFGESDIKVWIDEYQLVIFSCRDSKGFDLSAAVKQVEGEFSCKTGMVFYPEDGNSLNALTAKAYEASCRQTNSGPKRLLEKALKDDEFFLVYQPQVNSRSGSFIGVEALIRWRPDAAGRTVMPLEFLPIAEAEGMMDQICKWTLYEACRQNLVWQAKGRPTRISVNISTSYLLSPDFLIDLDQVVAETGVNPELLEIEVTENKGIDQFNLDRVVEVIQAVREKGIFVSLDDFGMEYNSLEILRVLPVDQIKIDKVFVQNIASHKVRVIVQGTIGMAQAIGIQCIAEGVETHQQVAILEKMGCFNMQGYLFGKPQPDLPSWRTLSFS